MQASEPVQPAAAGMPAPARLGPVHVWAARSVNDCKQSSLSRLCCWFCLSHGTFLICSHVGGHKYAGNVVVHVSYLLPHSWPSPLRPLWHFAARRALRPPVSLPASCMSSHVVTMHALAITASCAFSGPRAARLHGSLTFVRARCTQPHGDWFGRLRAEHAEKLLLADYVYAPRKASPPSCPSFSFHLTVSRSARVFEARDAASSSLAVACVSPHARSFGCVVHEPLRALELAPLMLFPGFVPRVLFCSTGGPSQRRRRTRSFASTGAVCAFV